MASSPYDKEAFTSYLQEKVDAHKAAIQLPENSFEHRQRIPFYVCQMMIGLGRLHKVAGPQNALNAAYNSQIKSGLMTKYPSTTEIDGIRNALDTLVSDLNTQFGLTLENPMRIANGQHL